MKTVLHSHDIMHIQFSELNFEKFSKKSKLFIMDSSHDAFIQLDQTIDTVIVLLEENLLTALQENNLYYIKNQFISLANLSKLVALLAKNYAIQQEMKFVELDRRLKHLENYLFDDTETVEL